MYSRPTKSASWVYAISLGIFSSNGDLGSPITVRTSFRECSRYMVKSTGLSPSPWCVPTLLVKGAFITALFILVLMSVLLNKYCMSLSSPSSTMFFRICRYRCGKIGSGGRRWRKNRRERKYGKTP